MSYVTDPVLPNYDYEPPTIYESATTPKSVIVNKRLNEENQEDYILSQINTSRTPSGSSISIKKFKR